MGKLEPADVIALRNLHKEAVRRAREWDRTLPGATAKQPRKAAWDGAEQAFEAALFNLITDSEEKV